MSKRPRKYLSTLDRYEQHPFAVAMRRLEVLRSRGVPVARVCELMREHEAAQGDGSPVWTLHGLVEVTTKLIAESDQEAYELPTPKALRGGNGDGEEPRS